MLARELLVEFYDPSEDSLGIAKLDDTRRPRLSFYHLQRLRKSKDIEKYDRLQHLNFLPDMYGQQPEQPM